MKGNSELKGSDTLYGFVWGPLEVKRACELPEGRGIVLLQTAHCALEVYFSAKGRTLRVFRGGKELKEVEG